MGIRYELGNGKTVILSEEDFFNLDDDKFNELIAKDSGIFISDPFADFDIKQSKAITLEVPDSEIEQLTEEEIQKIKKEIDGDY